MSDEPTGDAGAPFARDRLVDKPSIIGARWWHEALVDRDAEIARRTAIRNILIAGGVIAGFGAMLATCVKASSSGVLGEGAPAVSDARKTSLEMQKEYGWSFGAVGEPLVFDGVTTRPFEPGALQKLPVDLAPSARSLLPFFQATLFQSPDAQPPSLGKLGRGPTTISGSRAWSPKRAPVASRRATIPIAARLATSRSRWRSSS